MRKWTLGLLFFLFASLAAYTYVQYRSSKEKIAQATQPQLQPRNIYLITATGLRPDHLSSYLYQHIQTPAIDFLAYDGVRFTNSFTTATDSLSAHLSLLTGLYPFHQPVRQTVQHLWELSRSKLPKETTSLPTWFAQKGYRTAAFLADPELRYPSYFGNLFQDVATADKPLRMWEDAYSPAGLCSLARTWILQNRSKPHLALINFHEPAPPFQPPAPYDKQYANHLYDGEIAALDEQIGLFTNMLKDLGLFQKSVIIFTAPFAEGLEEASRFSSAEESTMRIPLLIAAPGILPRHQEYEAQTSLIDVLPTLLKILEQPMIPRLDGLPLFEKGSPAQISREYILGQNLFPKMLGFSPSYFVRSNRIFYSTAQDHEEPAEGSTLEDAKAQLRKEKLLVSNPVKIELDTDPGLLLQNTILMAQQGHPDWAMDLLQTYETQLPATTYLQNFRAELSAAGGNAAAALSSYQKAYAISENQALLVSIARIQLEQAQYQEARNTLKVVEDQLRPLSYDISSMIGIAFHGMGKNEEAIVCFEKALQGNPRYAEAYLYRGMSYLELGNRQAAESDFRKAVEANPQDVAAYHALANLLLQGNQGKEAIPYLRKLLTIHPQDYGAMLELARAHQEFGNETEARKLCQQIILYAKDAQLVAEAKEIVAGK